MASPHGLPYVGALDAVKRIENALTERDAAREASDSELEVAHTVALLARAQVDAESIRSGGDSEVRQLGRRVSAERDVLAAEFTALVLVEEL